MMMTDKLILSTLHMTYVVPIVKLTQRLVNTSPVMTLTGPVPCIRVQGISLVPYM